jgi:glycosyltransferase involved in cell wall biosynthesis
MEILLTIPAHNECRTIRNVIYEFREESKKLGITMGIQVIDDNSTDGTAEIVRGMGIKLYHVMNGSGLAEAFRTEMVHALHTSADYFIHVDGDGQHCASDMGAFLERMLRGEPLILGNRLHQKPDGMSDIKFDANVFLSRVVSSLCGQVIHDSQTGYRAFRRDVAESFRICGTFTYTQEQIRKAAYHGFQISEVPVHIAARIDGDSRLVKNPIYYLSRAFRDIETVLEAIGNN